MEKLILLFFIAISIFLVVCHLSDHIGGFLVSVGLFFILFFFCNKEYIKRLGESLDETIEGAILPKRGSQEWYNMKRKCKEEDKRIKKTKLNTPITAEEMLNYLTKKQKKKE